MFFGDAVENFISLNGYDPPREYDVLDGKRHNLQWKDVVEILCRKRRVAEMETRGKKCERKDIQLVGG
jgi:hypothetical protein